MSIEAFLTRDYVQNLVSEGKRVDGRKFEDRRELRVIKGYVSDKAPGSCRVFLGETDVIAGVSLAFGTPYADSPEEGVMTVSSELRPIADPEFEAGPPRENAIEVARVVDRGIRESGAIDVNKLFIEEEKVWMAYIDLHIINNDGNLIDACGIAAAGALRDARMPKIEDGEIIRGEWDGKLPVTCTPIPLTVAKIAGKLVVDPDLNEEYAMDARVTATTTDTLNAMQKGGAGSLTIEEVEEIVSKSFEKAGEIRKMLEE